MGWAQYLPNTLDWSPDGSRIVFYGFRASSTNPINWVDPGIYIVNADGTGSVQQIYSGYNAGSPKWTPDGTRIAFVIYFGTWYAFGNVYTMEVNNWSNIQQLTFTNNFNGGIDWSPDGTRIAFTNVYYVGDASINDIYIYTLAGQSVQRITTDGNSKGSLSWEPMPYTFPPTPTPTLTPTLSYCPAGTPVFVSNNSSRSCTPQEFYERFKGIIFWAIYNESNANQQEPLSVVLPSADTTVFGVFEDTDHRYVMARVIINNYILDNYGDSVDFMDRWRGWINNPSYNLWKNDTEGLCVYNGQPIGTYATARNNGAEAILDWFNGYAECFRSGNPLAGAISNFDDAYSDIMDTFISDAITDHLAGITHPAPDAGYVKHTSTCFVWQRNAANQITSCYGGGGLINMETFCNQAPTLRPTPTPSPTTHNCQPSPINPSNVNLATWLPSTEGRASNQQLGLETRVERNDFVNLGLYVPDLPSGLDCSNYCYFLMGNPASENSPYTAVIANETIAAALIRHEARHTDTYYDYSSSADSIYVYVLLTELDGTQTWITYVFQKIRKGMR